MTLSPREIEGTGPQFSESRLLDVRSRTRAALLEIAERITPGMAEDQGRAIASEVLRARGLRKGWHKVLVRFGVNTTKNFDDPSEPGVVLGEDDIFFVDIGPIHDGCEGDAGDSFVVGDDAEMIGAARDVKSLWHEVRDEWAQHETTGAGLYQFAGERASAMGWVLNLELTGHRLSEFPHSAHYDGTLSDIGFPPADLLWVLEIQIRHPVRPFGAFFEDLLLYDEGLQRGGHPPAA